MKKVLLTLTLLSVAANVYAADLLDTVQQRGTLKIALEGTYPPFNFKDKDQKLTGFEVELGAALAQKLKLKPEFITGEWSGLLAGLQGGGESRPAAWPEPQRPAWRAHRRSRFERPERGMCTRDLQDQMRRLDRVATQGRHPSVN